MKKEIQITIEPHRELDENYIKNLICKKIAVKTKEIKFIKVIRKSIDARQKKIKLNLKLRIYINEKYIAKEKQTLKYNNVANSEEIIIVGAGPAGLFAALKLIDLGKKPIIIERGKNVRDRRFDIAKITKEHIVNENSNYCFGEGGAGTYSDGKLYTRSKKRGDVNQILDILIENGANNNIKIDAHPHIGTNKLPTIIKNIREKIIECGGVILFNSKVIDLIIKSNKINGVKLENQNIIKSKKVILATGHSARDIFYLLHKKNIKIELKSFAIGVRVEHKQKLIDQIQYKCNTRSKFLPPASYSLVNQISNRGVYSFCMCPGGVIAPCATKQNEVVTNGWSPSRRNHPNSNSGIVVELKLNDFKRFKKFGPLAGIEFQKQIEKKAWEIAGRTQKAPAQKLEDFINNKLSKNIPETSYIPGITSCMISDILPKKITRILQDGFKKFDEKMPGYITNEAIIHAPETRTSSPIRIPRDKNSLEHVQIKGLYPCGEGAGYAGGIMSAAIDGMKCANKC